MNDTPVEPGTPAVRLLKVKTVAKMFDVTTKTIYEWAQSGYLQPIYVGDKKFTLRLDAQEVEARIQEGREGKTA